MSKSSCSAPVPGALRSGFRNIALTVLENACRELRVLAEVPERHRLLATFLAQSGLRISEALALTKADINFGNRRLSVSRRLYEGELDTPKSRHGVRQVPLSPGVAQQLWTLLAKQPDDALVFASKTGSYLDASNVMARVLKPAAAEAGLGE